MNAAHTSDPQSTDTPRDPARMHLLFDVLLHIQQSDSVETLIHGLSRSMCWLLDFADCWVALDDADDGFHFIQSPFSATVATEPSPADRATLELIAATGDTQRSTDVTGTTHLCLPLQTSERQLGSLLVSSTHRTAFNHADISFVKAIATFLSLAIDRLVTAEQLQISTNAIQHHDNEMQAAQLIQQKLLPEHPPEIPGLELAARYIPATATAGDFYDFFDLPDGRLAVTIGDVSGHGLGPALLMSSTRRVLRTLSDYHSDPGELLTAANRDICEDTGQERFVEIFLAAIDVSTKQFQHAGAGHAAWLYRDGQPPMELESTGLPTGLVEDQTIETGPTTALNAGDVLLLFTDGLTEAMNPDRDLLGIKEVHNLVQSHGNAPLESLLDRLVQSVHDHCAPGYHTDDITIVAIRAL